MGDQQSVNQLTLFFMPLHGIYPAPLSCQSASLRYATTVRCVRPWRRAYSRGIISHGLSSATTNCASSRHSILRFWRGPSPRAYSRGIISHGLLYRCSELCLFEALYPAPLARGPSPRACTRGLSHMGFHATATNCASSRHSILRLWRGPSPRAYAREEYSSP